MKVCTCVPCFHLEWVELGIVWLPWEPLETCQDPTDHVDSHVTIA